MESSAFYDVSSGYLTAARVCPSPNADMRPAGQLPELIVVHGISLPPGKFGGPWIDALFCNQLPVDADPYFEAIAGLRVSAHVLVRRDGELVQYVPLHQRAWHAGVSAHAARPSCNDFSIGIELEGTDDCDYDARQYSSLARVIRQCQQLWPDITRDCIVGHSDIAPGRKTDPGESFNWSRLMCEIDTISLDSDYARKK